MDQQLHQLNQTISLNPISDKPNPDLASKFTLYGQAIQNSSNKYSVEFFKNNQLVQEQLKQILIKLEAQIDSQHQQQQLLEFELNNSNFSLKKLNDEAPTYSRDTSSYDSDIVKHKQSIEAAQKKREAQAKQIQPVEFSKLNIRDEQNPLNKLCIWIMQILYQEVSQHYYWDNFREQVFQIDKGYDFLERLAMISAIKLNVDARSRTQTILSQRSEILNSPATASQVTELNKLFDVIQLIQTIYTQGDELTKLIEDKKKKMNSAEIWKDNSEHQKKMVDLLNERVNHQKNTGLFMVQTRDNLQLQLQEFQKLDLKQTDFEKKMKTNNPFINPNVKLAPAPAAPQQQQVSQIKHIEPEQLPIQQPQQQIQQPISQHREQEPEQIYVQPQDKNEQYALPVHHPEDNQNQLPVSHIQEPHQQNVPHEMGNSSYQTPLAATYDQPKAEPCCTMF